MAGLLSDGDRLDAPGEMPSRSRWFAATTGSPDSMRGNRAIREEMTRAVELVCPAARDGGTSDRFRVPDRGDIERGAVLLTREHRCRFRIALARVRHGIEVQRAAGPIREIRQGDQ